MIDLSVLIVFFFSYLLICSIVLLVFVPLLFSLNLEMFQRLILQIYFCHFLTSVSGTTIIYMYARLLVIVPHVSKLYFTYFFSEPLFNFLVFFLSLCVYVCISVWIDSGILILSLFFYSVQSTIK